jgi:hypothetical protein
MHRHRVGIPGIGLHRIVRDDAQETIDTRIENDATHHRAKICERDVLRAETAREQNDFREGRSPQPRVPDIDGNRTRDPIESIVERRLRARIELAVQVDDQSGPSHGRWLDVIRIGARSQAYER